MKPGFSPSAICAGVLLVSIVPPISGPVLTIWSASNWQSFTVGPPWKNSAGSPEQLSEVSKNPTTKVISPSLEV
ncbi:hypothetical protein B484DRAFT_451943 [Ochromonadaceae sp. CCMP2298]|nr:hypothetical protein B484DRAFT_451943 [Ochromonadaceae sp. CCMP2298]